jgi:ADP-ribose pyrophosphatase
LSQDGLPLEWAEIGVLSSDSYMILLRDLVEFPDGIKRGYIRIIHSATLYGEHGVIILPVLDEKVLLVNHFRHSTRKWHWEVPRGYGEPGVSSTETAHRELKEEIGAENSELISLGILHPETGFENQQVDLYLAKLASSPKPEINEGIESFCWITFPELEEWIVSEKITDGFTIAAYTKAKLKGLI